MDNRPIKIILNQEPDQTGGDWTIAATYPGGESDTIATLSAFMKPELVRKIADLIAHEHGLERFEKQPD